MRQMWGWAVTGFTLLWSKILDSSIWVTGSKETRLVWIAMLAMKNSQGQIFASVVGLADRAKVSVDECRKALKVLLSPDPNDTSKVEEGRRIREIQGGWEIVNHDLYRFSTEAKREFWKSVKAEQRAKAAEQKSDSKPRRKSSKSGPLRGEEEALRKLQNGEISQEEADAIAANTREGKT